MKKMQWIASGLIAALMGATVAIANDAETSVDKSADTSRNPITGTVTVTKKYKRHSKDLNSKAKDDVKEVTKYKTDGSVEAKKTTDSSRQAGE